MIPKIIHYCWLSNDPIPENMQHYVTSWKKVLPDYEFIKWDFNRFDKESSKWVSEAFDNKKYAFAADYIRLYAIYTMGGIYMDMDIEVLKPFDDLLNDKYMMAYENERAKSIEAGCFGAERGASFIKNVLEYYTNRSFIKNDGSFDTLPLPQVMEKVLINNPENIRIMDWHTFTNKSFGTGIESPNKESYAIHHFAGSWKSDAEKSEIQSYQKLTSKYGYSGRLIFWFQKYILHPKRIWGRLKSGK